MQIFLFAFSDSLNQANGYDHKESCDDGNSSSDACNSSSHDGNSSEEEDDDQSYADFVKKNHVHFCILFVPVLGLFYIHFFWILDIELSQAIPPYFLNFSGKK